MRAENLKQRRSPEAYNRPEVHMLLVFKRCYIAEPSNISIQGKFEMRNSNLLKKKLFHYSLGQYWIFIKTIVQYKSSTGPRSGPIKNTILGKILLFGSELQQVRKLSKSNFDRIFFLFKLESVFWNLSYIFAIHFQLLKCLNMKKLMRRYNQAATIIWTERVFVQISNFSLL